MLPALATPEELETRMGVELDDQAQAGWLLDQASAIARAFAGRTWTNEAGTALQDVPDGVAGVVVEMVLRVYQNPEGVVQDTAGPYSVSFGTSAADRLYLTSADKLILRGSGGHPKAFSTSTIPATSPLNDLHGAVVNGPEGWAPGET